MPAADKHAPIEYGIYAAPDMPALARLLAEVFSQRDPLGVAAGLSSAELEAYVLLLCPKAAAEGLTVVARRTDTRELVGAMLTEDSASAVPDGMERISPKFARSSTYWISLARNTTPTARRTPASPSICFFSALRNPIPARAWRSILSPCVSSTARTKGIDWQSPRRPARYRSTSSASRDLPTACDNLTSATSSPGALRSLRSRSRAALS